MNLPPILEEWIALVETYWYMIIIGGVVLLFFAIEVCNLVTG